MEVEVGSEATQVLCLAVLCFHGFYDRLLNADSTCSIYLIHLFLSLSVLNARCDLEHSN